MERINSISVSAGYAALKAKATGRRCCMNFELGDRVLRKSTRDAGFVYAIRRKRAVMVEVKWESDGHRTWLPSEELIAWDRAENPPSVKKSGWGNTTPEYLIDLRAKIAKHPEKNRKKEKKLMGHQLTKDLLNLSEDRKSVV